MSPGEASRDFGAPMNFPCLLGVYLAANAVPDSFLLVDGPDCALYKAHFIHGRHDWGSTLLRISGRHRVAFTNVCARGVVREHDQLLAGRILALEALEEAGAVLVTALPMCSITGVDYGRVIRGLGPRRKPVLEIPPGSLTGDWLDGYAQALEALAQGLDLEEGRKAGTVALVGYLMDRNEADHLANLAELRRLLRGLSLELSSVWLGGEPIGSLRRAGRAERIVSLPYGRKAARRLSERTGAGLIEAELPFGLPKTAAFLRAVGQGTGRGDLAEALIASELSRVVPRLEWVLPHLFLNRRVAFVGDPHLLGGFLDIAEETGMSVAVGVVTGRPSHGGRREGLPVFHEPCGRAEDEARGLMEGLDLVVSSGVSEGRAPGEGGRVLEFGFPSYSSHALFERPFLGTNGFLAFVERMAERLGRDG